MAAPPVQRASNVSAADTTSAIMFLSGDEASMAPSSARVSHVSAMDRQRPSTDEPEALPPAFSTPELREASYTTSDLFVQILRFC